MQKLIAQKLMFLRYVLSWENLDEMFEKSGTFHNALEMDIKLRFSGVFKE